eukprot:GGOE01058164.1.p1 GENE.GGOE01058164.1~~GGOE01058164.1.p1  ORF type:complete len:1112 (-),score=260.64 GGOE01058164.1:189-3524(-)
MALFGLWLWLIWGIGAALAVALAFAVQRFLGSRPPWLREILSGGNTYPYADEFALRLYSLTFVANSMEERYRLASSTTLKASGCDLGLYLLCISMTAVGITYAQLPSGDAAAFVFATIAAVASLPLLFLPERLVRLWILQVAVVCVATCWVVWAAVVGQLGAALPLLFLAFASAVTVQPGVLPIAHTGALAVAWLVLLLAIWGGKEGFCTDGVGLDRQLSPTSLLLALEIAAVALIAAYRAERGRREAFGLKCRSDGDPRTLLELHTSGSVAAVVPVSPPPPHLFIAVGAPKVHPEVPEPLTEAVLTVDSTSEISCSVEKHLLTDTSSSAAGQHEAGERAAAPLDSPPPGGDNRHNQGLQAAVLEVETESSVSVITTTAAMKPGEVALAVAAPEVVVDPTVDSYSQLPYLGPGRTGDEPLNSLQRAAQRRALAPPPITLLQPDTPPTPEDLSPFSVTAHPKTWVLPGVGATQLGLSHRRGTVLIIALKMSTADGVLAEFEEVDRMVCQIAMSQAEAFHGVVHLFGGGSVTISWNAFRPHPEHEIQACHCALAIQQQVASVHEWAQGRLEACYMAINSGPLVCGIGGTAMRKTQVLFGATVQTAQRLVVLNEALEAPVTLTQTVYEAVQGTHGCLIADYVKPGESTERIAVYELCSATPLSGLIFDVYRRAFLDFSGHRYHDCVEKLLNCASHPDATPALQRQALRLMALANAKSASPALFHRTNPYCRTDGWQRDPEGQSLPPELLRRLQERGFQPSTVRRAHHFDLDSSTRKSVADALGSSMTSPCEPPSPKSEFDGPSAAAGNYLAFGSADVKFTDTNNRQWHCSTTVLGAGAFGDVYLAMNEAGMPAAVKRVKLGSNVAANLPQEIKLLSKYRHENIVAYLGSGLIQSTIPQVLIVMEYVACGSLESLLKKFGKFQESSVQRYTRDIVRGLSYLHNNGVLHRDVKPANVLVEQTGVCKLADFGTAAMLQHNESHGADLVGTPQYMAPEVLEGDVSNAGDIWAVGVTCLQLVTGKSLLDILTVPGDSRLTITQTNSMSRTAATVIEIVTAQSDGAAAQYLFALSLMEDSPDLPSAIQGDVRAFISSCLQIVPKDRPSADDLLQSPFLFF